MKENEPQLWDKVWKNSPSEEEYLFNLIKEENSVRWQRIEKIVLKEFGSFNGLKVIEIGAGAGTYAALMVKKGAIATILDYSENAIIRAREFFKNNKLSAEFIQQDALSLSDGIVGKYDISISFGLTEHFKGTQRVKIHEAHFDVLRKGGITFISVPNKYNPPYRIYKFIAELIGRWNVGEEYPFSRKELTNISKQIGITEYLIFGESLFSSLNFINPMKVVRKVFDLKKPLNISKIKKEKSTFLDEYLSYALIYMGKNN